MKQLNNWSKYRPVHFKISLLWSGMIHIPSSLVEEGINGYFYLSADNSIIHLFDLEKEEYCFLDSFEIKKEASYLNPENNVCYIKKDPKLESFVFKNKLYLVSDNYFYFGGWYRQLIKN